MVLVYTYTTTDFLYFTDYFASDPDLILFRGALPDDFDGKLIVFDYFNHLGDKFAIAAHMGIDPESINNVLHFVEAGNVEWGGANTRHRKIVVKNWQKKENLANPIGEFFKNKGDETI